MAEQERPAKKSYRTRVQIMDAFVDLMADKDFDTITVKSVAAKANITRGTFYLYFSDIYELVSYMENMLMGEMPDITPNIRSVRDPRTPPTLAEYENDTWERTWFEYYGQYSRYFNSLLGPHGDQSFVIKMKKRIQAALTVSMMLDAMPEDQYQGYFINLLPNIFLFLAREWTCSKDSNDLNLEDVVNMALTIRIGSIYSRYLEMMEQNRQEGEPS